MIGSMAPCCRALSGFAFLTGGLLFLSGCQGRDGSEAERAFSEARRLAERSDFRAMDAELRNLLKAQKGDDGAVGLNRVAAAFNIAAEEAESDKYARVALGYAEAAILTGGTDAEMEHSWTLLAYAAAHLGEKGLTNRALDKARTLGKVASSDFDDRKLTARILARRAPKVGD